jgi:hypothetical protein
MERNEQTALSEATRAQIEHFRETDRHCRAMQLPDGLLLRYTLSQSLYFYLRSGVDSGNLTTRVFASDSPYDREKADIGEVRTPIFAPQADHAHLQNLERLLRSWIDFVRETDPEQGFKSFALGDRRD